MATSKASDPPDFGPPLLFMVGLATIGVIGYLVHATPFSRSAKETTGFALAFLFGALVGATELISRYRDRPLAAVGTLPGSVYLLVNGFAALAMTWLIYSGRLRLGVSLFGPGHPLIDAVTMGGFGAMALFRSSIFVVRVRDTNVSVGPAAALQEILRTTDRQTDRNLAEPRASAVKEIMQGVVFRRARVSLPAHCLNLMQNVNAEEREALNQAVAGLTTEDIPDQVKSYSLGLLLMNLVGQEVLTQGVQGLGDGIRGPAPDDAKVLVRASLIVGGDLPALLELCRALAPDLARRIEQERRRTNPAFTLQDLVTPPAGITDPKRVVVIVLTRLRTDFTQEVVDEALGLVIATSGARGLDGDAGADSFRTAAADSGRPAKPAGSGGTGTPAPENPANTAGGTPDAGAATPAPGGAPTAGTVSGAPAQADPPEHGG